MLLICIIGEDLQTDCSWSHPNKAISDLRYCRWFKQSSNSMTADRGTRQAACCTDSGFSLEKCRSRRRLGWSLHLRGTSLTSWPTTNRMISLGHQALYFHQRAMLVYKQGLLVLKSDEWRPSAHVGISSWPTTACLQASAPCYHSNQASKARHWLDRSHVAGKVGVAHQDVEIVVSLLLMAVYDWLLKPSDELPSFQVVIVSTPRVPLQAR